MNTPLAGYDYTRSTSENHAQPDAPLSREFFASRAGLDYGWHVRYSAQRQYLQDSIIREMLAPAQRANSPGKRELSAPWALFTAGCMGAGKTHVMVLLARHELLPLKRFVRIDMDRIREALPETEGYVRLDKRSAGAMTQKEAGAIAEIASEEALAQKLNVWIDSSLQDADWWAGELVRIRRTYPHRLAIVHVTASLARVQEREVQRGMVTGRRIPPNVLRAVYNKVPASVERLKPLVDEYVEVDNNHPSQPRLRSPADVRSFLRFIRGVGGGSERIAGGNDGARDIGGLENWMPAASIRSKQ